MPIKEEKVVAKWYLSLLLLRIVPPILFGILLGFVCINHKPLSLQSTFSGSSNFILIAADQIYFGWYFFVWSVVYIGGLFLLFLRPIARGIFHGIFRFRGPVHSEFTLGLIYGVWVCGQITGAWVESDNSRCFREGNCRYSIIASSVWSKTFFNRETSQQPILDNANTFEGVEEYEVIHFFFFPRLLYTIIGTILATLVSSLICDDQCCLISFVLFYEFGKSEKSTINHDIF